MTTDGHSPISLIYTTLPDDETARRIAGDLVRRRLAACANLMAPVRAIYRWKGEIEEAGETVLILKTGRGGVAALRAALAELHPYEVPAIIELPANANSAFAGWIDEETGEAGG